MKPQNDVRDFQSIFVYASFQLRKLLYANEDYEVNEARRVKRVRGQLRGE